MLPEPIHRLLPLTPYALVANCCRFRKLCEPGRMSGQGLRIVPYAGHKGYQCYLDGWKVNGKRKRSLEKQQTRDDSKQEVGEQYCSVPVHRLPPGCGLIYSSFKRRYL